MTQPENHEAASRGESALERGVRPRFEAWARANGHLDLSRSELRRDWYGNGYVNDAWLVWQAAEHALRTRLADEWDGCMYDVAGEGQQDIGATIRGA